MHRVAITSTSKQLTRSTGCMIRSRQQQLRSSRLSSTLPGKKCGPASIVQQRKCAQEASKSTLAPSSSSSSSTASTSIRNSNHALSWDQMKAVMMNAAVPMIGFGFMDNFVMIQAGSFIDSTLGVKFGLATLTAAAMGQVVSDVSGVLCGGTLEKMMSPYVRPARLTSLQQQLAIVPRLRLAGAAMGVIVGCLLGATTLVFVLNSEEEVQQEKAQQLQSVLQDMLHVSSSSIGNSTSCTMHLTQAPSSCQTTRDDGIAVVGGAGDEHDHSMVMQCLEQKFALNQGDTLCLPVYDNEKEEPVAVLEMEKEGGFSSDDTEEAERVARHLGIFMDRVMKATSGQ